MSSLTITKYKGPTHKILVHSTKEGSINIDRISVIRVDDVEDGNLQISNSTEGDVLSSKQKQQLKIKKKEQQKMEKKSRQSVESRILTSIDVLESGRSIICNGISRSAANRKAKAVNDSSLNVKTEEASYSATTLYPTTSAVGFVKEIKLQDTENGPGGTNGKKPRSGVNKKTMNVKDSSLSVTIKEPSCSITVSDSSKSTLGFTREVHQKNIKVRPTDNTVVPDSLKCTLGFVREIKQQRLGCLDENSVQNTEGKENRKFGKAKITVNATRKSLLKEENGSVNIVSKTQVKKVKKELTPIWKQSKVHKIKRERLSSFRVSCTRRDSIICRNIAEDLCVETVNIGKPKPKVKSDASVQIESENVGKAKKSTATQAFQKPEGKIQVPKTKKLEVKNETSVRRSKRLSLLPVISYKE